MRKFTSFSPKLGFCILCLAHPPTHQKIDSFEINHGCIVEVGLSLLAHMPLNFSDKAYLVVVFLINHTTSKFIDNSTSLELFSYKTLLLFLFNILGVPVG